MRPILRGVKKLVPWQTFLIVSTMSGGKGEKREVRGVMREGNGPGGRVMRDEWGNWMGTRKIQGAGARG